MGMAVRASHSFRRALLSGALGLLLCAPIALSWSADDADLRQHSVDALFAAAERAGAPGAAIGIYRHGVVIYSKCFGHADLEHNVLITPQTAFHVASVSKQFTAFAIALLERDGKLNVDSDIRRYLPYVPDFGRPITVRHLLHHTSGLRDQMELAITRGDTRESLLRQGDVLNMVANQRELNFAPGTEYSYGNTGYTLLAEIVEAVSGQTLRQFTNARIFQPLGMTHTFFSDSLGEIVPNRAFSYAGDGPWRRVPLNYETVGATGLTTTLTDMLRWAANFSHPTVGDAELIRHIGTSGRTTSGTLVNYGFGLELLKVAGHDALTHTGYDAAYRAGLAYFPAHDLAIVLLRNDGGDPHYPLAAIADLYLNERTVPASRVPESVPADGAWLAASPGHYLDRYGKMVSLELQAGRLLWRTAAADPTPVMFRADGTFDLGPDQRTWSYFRIKKADADGRVAFERVETEGPGSVTLYQRVERANPSVQELTKLAGAYRSAELDVTYTFSVENEHLVARSLRLAKPLVFKPSVTDRFDSQGWELSTIVFERDPRGNPVALRAHVGNSRNIRFDRSASNR
jgi:CubicO group peptidase (beta-lactamase class C family)